MSAEEAMEEEDEEQDPQPKNSDFGIIKSHLRSLKYAAEFDDEENKAFYKNIDRFSKEISHSGEYDALYALNAVHLAQDLLEVHDELFPWQVVDILEKINYIAKFQQYKEDREVALKAVQILVANYDKFDTEKKEMIIEGIQDAAAIGKYYEVYAINEMCAYFLFDKMIESQEERLTQKLLEGLLHIMGKKYISNKIVNRMAQKMDIIDKNDKFCQACDIIIAELKEKNSLAKAIMTYDIISKITTTLLKIDENIADAKELANKKIEIALQVKKNLELRVKTESSTFAYLIYTARDMLVFSNNKDVQKIGIEIIVDVLYYAKDEDTYIKALSEVQRLLKIKQLQELVAHVFSQKKQDGQEPYMAKKYSTDTLIYNISMDKNMLMQAMRNMQKSNAKKPNTDIKKLMLN